MANKFKVGDSVRYIADKVKNSIDPQVHKGLNDLTDQSTYLVTIVRDYQDPPQIGVGLTYVYPQDIFDLVTETMETQTKVDFKAGDFVKLVSFDSSNRDATFNAKEANLEVGKVYKVLENDRSDHNLRIEYTKENGITDYTWVLSDMFELAQNPGTVTATPTEPIPVTESNAVIGLKIMPGPGWDSNCDQRSNNSKYGIIRVIDTDKTCKVTWENDLRNDSWFSFQRFYVYQEPTNTTKTSTMITVKKSLITAGYSAATDSLAQKIKAKFTNVDLFADTVQVEEEFIKECHTLACEDWKTRLKAEFPTVFKKADPVQELIDKLGNVYDGNKAEKYTTRGHNFLRLPLPIANDTWTFAAYDWAKKFCTEYNAVTGQYCYPSHEEYLPGRYIYIKVN